MKKILIALLAFTLVAVAQAAITDLSARTKGTKVSLMWTPQGPGSVYDVYRRQVPATASTLIGSTTSDYSTYLDTGLVIGVTYCYQVVSGGFLSNEACATASARSRR